MAVGSYFKHLGAWKRISNDSNAGAYVKKGGVWTRGPANDQGSYVKRDGVWRPTANPPTTFTYLMDWSASYSGTSINTSSNRDVLNYEGRSSIHGDESSLWGFDYAQMQADLAGKTITAVEVRLTSRWSFGALGKNFHVMQHNHATKPASVSLGTILEVAIWERGETRSVDLPLSFGEALRDGTQKGVGLRFNDPSDNGWGYMTGTHTTTVLTSSPQPSEIVVCPNGEKAMITVSAV